MCITASQMQWTADVTKALGLSKERGDKKALKSLKKKQVKFQSLNTPVSQSPYCLSSGLIRQVVSRLIHLIFGIFIFCHQTFIGHKFLVSVLISFLLLLVFCSFLDSVVFLQHCALYKFTYLLTLLVCSLRCLSFQLSCFITVLLGCLFVFVFLFFQQQQQRNNNSKL